MKELQKFYISAFIRPSKLFNHSQVYVMHRNYWVKTYFTKRFYSILIALINVWFYAIVDILH